MHAQTHREEDVLMMGRFLKQLAGSVAVVYMHDIYIVPLYEFQRPLTFCGVLAPLMIPPSKLIYTLPTPTIVGHQ